MTFLTRLLLPLFALGALAAPLHAQTMRSPATGTPAVEVTTPPGWTGERDQDGNLTLMAKDATGAILLTMLVADPGEPIPANEILAATFFAELGANPPGKARKTTWAGAPAETYKSSMAEDGFAMDVELVLRRAGDRSIAMGVVMIPANATAEQRRAVAAHFAAVKIITR